MKCFALSIHLFVLSPVICTIGDSFYCGRGEYMIVQDDGRQSCKPCPGGMYMDDPEHTNLECATCKMAEYFNYEVEAEKCTKTKDTVILCDENHFRQLHGPDVMPYCQKCSRCGQGRQKNRPVMRKPCGDYHDTECDVLHHGD